MKIIILGVTMLSSLQIFAESHTSIVCGSSSGATGMYYPNGDYWGDINIGCGRSVSLCAVDSLNNTISLIPEKGNASFSGFFKKYVETKQKSLSKLVLDSRVDRSPVGKCVEGHIYRDLYVVDCNRSTACVTVSVDFDVCTKVTYDQESGAKIVTCPSGRVIKESN